MKERLDVLFLSPFPSRENPLSGLCVRDHARAVAREHRVTVLSPPRWPTAIAKTFAVSESMHDGMLVLRVQYRRSRIPKTTLFMYCYAIVATCVRLIRRGFRPDVIHGHFSDVALPGLLASRMLRIPFVLTEHSSIFSIGLPGPRRVEARLAMSRVDLLLPVSESLRRHLADHGVHAPCRVVPNPVDTALFHPAAPVRRRTSGRKRILWVGRLDPIKGIPGLLESLRLLGRDDVDLDIVGDGAQRGEYEALAAELGVTRVVHFLGFQPQERVAEFMRDADLLVLPSLSENCPCSILEASASGLPVVATEVGGIPEIVTKDTGLLVPHNDPEALSVAIEAVLDGRCSFDQATMAAYARERFGLPTVGRLLGEAYRDAIPARRG